MEIAISPQTTNYFWALNSLSRHLIARGGTGSSKSYSLSGVALTKFLTEKNINFLVLRKTLPALKFGTYKDFEEIRDAWGVTDSIIRHQRKDPPAYFYKNNNNWLQFASLDDPGKIKSTKWNYIWFEEFNDFNITDFDITRLYIRNANKNVVKLPKGEIIKGENRMNYLHTPEGKVISLPMDGLDKPLKVFQNNGDQYIYRPNQIWGSFNPIDENHWIKTDMLDKVDRSGHKAYYYDEKVSTYRDNPWYPEDLKVDLERTAETNPNYYRVYGLGEWGRLENIIFTNWDIVDRIPVEVDLRQNTLYGQDYGGTDPTVMLKIVVDIDKFELWIDELIYERGQEFTNSKLIARMNEIGVDRGIFIYGDNAEPSRIAEIKEAGYSIMPCVKGKDSVDFGIDFLLRFKVHITKRSLNTIKEIKSYCRKVDKITKKPKKDPIEFNDHCMSAWRYPMYSHYGVNMMMPGVMLI